MEQLGTSYISTADLLVCGIALALFRWLAFPPKNATLSNAIALVSAGAVVVIGAALFLVDLNEGAVGELSMIDLGLCATIGLWDDKRKKHASPAASSELPKHIFKDDSTPSNAELDRFDSHSGRL